MIYIWFYYKEVVEIYQMLCYYAVIMLKRHNAEV